MSDPHCHVSIAEGRLRGSARDGVRRFLGVPYAAPPVGTNRFRAPQPVAPWSGGRDATKPGPNSPHAVPKTPGLDLSTSFAPGWIEGEDFLTLNLWRPDDERVGLPVLVYIHGGGFINGSKDIPIIDGSAFARDGVVCININYRLGVEGFLPIPDVPTNLGLRDQIAALQWVQRNVRSFGGDPANVTVAGESAGGVSTACLMASPLARGLFRRAIVHAPTERVVATQVARKVVERMARMLKITPDAEGFRRLSPREAVKAQNRIALALIDLRNSGGIEPALGLSKFLPVHGDEVVPMEPQAAIAAGAGAEVELLVCTCREETNTWMVPLAVHRWMFAWLARSMLGWFHPRPAEVLQAYGLGQRGRNSGEVFTAVLTDLFLRAPSRLLAEQHHGQAHVMEFDWRSPALGGRYGAAHGNVVPFIFDTLPASTGPKRILGPDPPQALAARYHGAWVRFVKGEPLGWPAFDGTSRAVYSLVRGTAGYEAPTPAAAFVSG